MKNILICVSGLTPQIITETFYCLTVQQKKNIDELYVLTTKRGKAVILGKDKRIKLKETKKELQKLCNKYKVKLPKFDDNDEHIIVAKEESTEMSDIRNDKQNKLFPNKVCEFIREKTSDKKTRLFCSISGGRKTMSVYISYALSIFGRNEDKLMHVLTSEKNEFKNFFPENESEDKELELSEVPFVKLRSVLPEKLDIATKSFEDIVNYTQNSLKLILSDSLLLNLKERSLKYRERKITLHPRDFAVYYFFVRNLKTSNEAISINQLIKKETAKQIFSIFVDSYGMSKEEFISDLNNKDIDTKFTWWNTGFQKKDFNSIRSKLNSEIVKLIDNKQLSENFRIQSNKRYGNTSYCIKTDPSKFIIA